MVEKSVIIKAALIVGGIILLLILVIISMSFSFLDYHQYGFKRQKSTSRVFTDKVYTGGRHLIGPDFEFKVYPAAAQRIQVTKATVFSKDALEVFLDLNFEYFLRPQQLHLLHQKYQLTYNSVIRSSALDALKVAAVQFTTEELIKNRTLLENAMEKAVRLRIGGKCCEADCTKDKCEAGCIPLTSCTSEADMGLMVNMRYFYLTKLQVPSKVYNRYLKALLLVEDSQKAKYSLEEAVVKKEIDESVKAIDNQANEISQNATAQASFITRKANAEAQKILGEYRGEGLNMLMANCGITAVKEKMSLYYLETLRESSKVNMAVDFSNYVIGGK